MSEKEFLEQIRLNQGIIYKLVSLYAVDGEEKKDLYQEILLQAWKSWPHFRRAASFSTWLYRISLNTILTQRRKKPLIDYRDSLERGVAPSAGAEGWAGNAGGGTWAKGGEEWRGKMGSLQWAIRQLPETDRAIVSLHLDGYENSEIAAVTGISNNHVSVKLHRIKKQLAIYLKHEL